MVGFGLMMGPGLESYTLTTILATIFPLLLARCQRRCFQGLRP